MSDRPASLPSGEFLFRFFMILAAAFMAFAFLLDTPAGLAQGLWAICTSRAALITDSILVGGAGAALFNAGLVLLYSTWLVRRCQVPFTGITAACLLLMAGFALFGKDILNIQPFLVGGWLWAKYQREYFSRYIYSTLFATSLSPVLSEAGLLFSGPARLAAMLAVGVAIGFLMPPICAFAVRLHRGYDLYNVGFAAGLVGLVFASFCRSFGYEFETQLKWSTHFHWPLCAGLSLLFAALLGLGLLRGASWACWKRLLARPGRLVSDFVLLDGLGPTLFNMGLVGFLGLGYLFCIGAPLNGPTAGGLLTLCGFAALGKHPKNSWPPMAGVALASLVMTFDLRDPNVVLASLFSTCLAPVAGQFGWKWGFVAGVLHAAVVMNVGGVHGWMNLYNNGFAAGLVCIVLVPVIEELKKGKSRSGKEEREGL